MLYRRKDLRLKNYDYSQNGYYFITICLKDGHCILSKINVGDGVLDVPLIHLTKYGEIIDKYINQLNNWYENIEIHKYIIMPNHIHFIIEIKNEINNINGTSRTPSPTNMFLPKFISTLKRFINKEIGFPIFQRSYYDEIIKNQEHYDNIYYYIENNPSQWNEDKYNPKNFKE